MRERPVLSMQWLNSGEKRRWLRALARLLGALEETPMLYKLEGKDLEVVRARLKQEFDCEEMKWPLDRVKLAEKAGLEPAGNERERRAKPRGIAHSPHPAPSAARSRPNSSRPSPRPP